MRLDVAWGHRHVVLIGHSGEPAAVHAHDLERVLMDVHRVPLGAGVQQPPLFDRPQLHGDRRHVMVEYGAVDQEQKAACLRATCFAFPSRILSIMPVLTWSVSVESFPRIEELS